MLFVILSQNLLGYLFRHFDYFRSAPTRTQVIVAEPYFGVEIVGIERYSLLQFLHHLRTQSEPFESSGHTPVSSSKLVVDL